MSEDILNQYINKYSTLLATPEVETEEEKRRREEKERLEAMQQEIVVSQEPLEVDDTDIPDNEVDFNPDKQIEEAVSPVQITEPKPEPIESKGSDYYLNLYASKMLGEPNYKIVMAKNRLTLKKYGGILSISQYRQMMKHKDKMINVYKPPLVPVLYLMEEFVEDVNPYIRKNSKPVSLDDKKSDEAVARNKLVVSKQKSSGITIENCMKIKKK